MEKMLRKIRKILKEKNLDSLLVTHQANVVYLTGIPILDEGERECLLFITQENSVIFTFPTIFEAIKKFKPENKVVNLTAINTLADNLNRLCKVHKIKNIGIEGNRVTLNWYLGMKKSIKYPLVETTGLVEGVRVIKVKEEIDKIRDSAGITDKIFRRALPYIKTGISEKELALKIEYLLKEVGDIAFSPIVAFGKNTSIPHHYPSPYIKLNKNIPILLDFGAKIAGYCADMTRMVYFGTPDNQFMNLYQTALTTLNNVLEKLKVGIRTGDIDTIARQFISFNNYQPYMHGLGHGVGLEIHEEPRLRSTSKDKTLEGMVFTVEPGIYIPGKYGVRIEDLVVLRKNDTEVLTKTPKDLIIIR